MATARAGGVPIVNGDIGCYEQAGYGVFASDFKPSFSTRSVKYKDESLYDYLDTNYIMGGGIGLAQGQYWADYKDGPIVAVAGDSTFFHACMPALVNAVYNKAKIAFIIFDNSWTAMTGHQPHPGTGLTATGTETIALAIENIVKAFGVEYVRIVESYDLRKNVDAVLEAIRYPGPAVVVSKHVCVLHAMRLKQLASHPFYVDKEKCTSCRLCVRLGCPAVTWDEKTKKAGVDSITCIGCGMCGELCPVKAISPVRQKVD
jgi:indolepyruvate ferredoxin oxidoreductase alpha subunit